MPAGQAASQAAIFANSPRLEEMNVACSDEADPPDDLVSFEVISHPGPSEVTEHLQFVEVAQDKAKLKGRLVSAWNNVKYAGWPLKSKPRLSKSSPVCLLGHKYLLSSEGECEQFRRGFSSLLWLTYRRGFTPVGSSSLTSDCGWGCMLRTAQMLLAKGLLTHMMPEDWTWPSAPHLTRDDLEVKAPRQLRARLWRRRSEGRALDSSDHQKESQHRHLVAWFADTPSAQFSLHQLVEVGMASGKRAGDWYGPSTAAYILRKAVAASDLTNLAVYVAQDCTVYVEDLVKLCEEPQSECSKSIIILVPVRLGGDSLNPVYIQCVKQLLQLKQCIGIIGGKPKHSLYFVGFQDDKLIYLDPHLCQAAVDVNQENFPLESFHCKAVKKMSFHRMDPSCTLGFYAKNRSDFETLRSEVTEALTSSIETYPIFTFVEGSGQDEHMERESSADSISYVQVKVKPRQSNKCRNMDDFVLL